jgi:hypothetical protein
MKLYGVTIEKPEGALTLALHDGGSVPMRVDITCNIQTNDPGFLRDVALAIHEAAERLDALLTE